MRRTIAPILVSALLLTGCGIGRDSGFSPFGWLARDPSRTASLTPEGGYVRTDDLRPGIPRLTAARWEPLTGGRLVVVTGLAPTTGYHSVALISARRQPGDRLQADADGVLRLRMVGVPPAPGAPGGTMPADPATDLITAALALSDLQLARISRIEIAGAADILTLPR